VGVHPVGGNAGLDGPVDEVLDEIVDDIDAEVAPFLPVGGADRVSVKRIFARRIDVFPGRGDG